MFHQNSISAKQKSIVKIFFYSGHLVITHPSDLERLSGIFFCIKKKILLPAYRIFRINLLKESVL